MKIPDHLKERWIRYLFEMVAIILGILGALALDNWNQNRKDSRRMLDAEIGRLK